MSPQQLPSKKRATKPTPARVHATSHAMADYQTHQLGDLALESGQVLPAAFIAYKTYGDASLPCIIYPTWFSGSISDNEWLIRQDGPLSPLRYFIVVPALFGNGQSSSPSHTGSPRPFPRVTVRDNVTAQHRLLTEILSVTHARCVLGWSMGAAQTYQWITQFPDFCDLAVPFCGSARTALHNQVFLEGVKAALLAAKGKSSAGSCCGETAGDEARPWSEEEAAVGLKAVGRVYAGWGFSQAFYRERLYEKELGYRSLEDFMRDFWEAWALSKHPENLLVMLHTWQASDCSAQEPYSGDFGLAMRGIKAKTLVLPGQTDLYFPVEDAEEEVRQMRQGVGKCVAFPSIWGHWAGGPGLSVADLEWLEALTKCLAQQSVPFTVQHVSGDDEIWARATSSYNLRLNYTPSVVAMVRSAADVSAAVRCGVASRTCVTAKSGGHSFGGYGLGGEDGHLVISLQEMKKITPHATKTTARIEPGARLRDVASSLYAWRKRAISHGSCLGVGIGGHVLHGGFGLASRTYGLALDWLVAAVVVLADGSLVRCSSTQRRDLFWAIRGAGSSFAIVVELEFETFAAPEKVTPFSLVLDDVDGRTLEALQAFAVEAPAEMNFMMDLAPGSKTVSGVLYGGGDVRRALGPLLRGVRGRLEVGDSVGWMEALMMFDDVPVDPAAEHDTFYATSIMTNSLPRPNLDALLTSLSHHQHASAKRQLYLSIEAHGGPNSAVSNVSFEDESSYGQRDKLLLFQLFDASDESGRYPSSGFDDLRRIRESLVGGGVSDWGMFANYLDDRLDAATAARRYWGSGGLSRLRGIKGRYDPEDVFWNPQGVRPLLSPEENEIDEL
ncbi:hypothetical protein CP532_1353 [Ophiocordyceps camponoti-leonardi (nom. inval.)]|nr:hypothetical protein CP532_1353 [Ophiocordyceps camponoti-leonardi (nom. inval.)]